MLGWLWRVGVGRFKEEPHQRRKRRTIQWRRNVLALVGMGYALTLVVFVMLILEANMPANGAFEIVTAPMMALVGGSLAISKDLIGADDDEARSNGNEGLGDNGNHQGDADEGGNADEQEGQ